MQKYISPDKLHIFHRTSFAVGVCRREALQQAKEEQVRLGRAEKNIQKHHAALQVSFFFNEAFFVCV